MKYNKKYMEKMMEDPFPPLPEDERIYLNVPSYKECGFAQISNCGFDAERKLWFTGPHNSNLQALVKLYGVNKATSVKAMQLLKEKMGNRI